MTGTGNRGDKREQIRSFDVLWEEGEEKESLPFSPQNVTKDPARKEEGYPTGRRRWGFLPDKHAGSYSLKMWE